MCFWDHDDINLECNQFGRKSGEPLGLPLGIPADNESDRELDQPRGRLRGGWLARSLADLNYWRRAGSSDRLMTAPHVQVIQIHSSSAPPSQFSTVAGSSRNAASSVGGDRRGA